MNEYAVQHLQKIVKDKKLFLKIAQADLVGAKEKVATEEEKILVLESDIRKLEYTISQLSPTTEPLPDPGNY
jgi:cob(I)alamin adenosyltransferase